MNSCTFVLLGEILCHSSARKCPQCHLWVNIGIVVIETHENPYVQMEIFLAVFVDFDGYIVTFLE